MHELILKYKIYEYQWMILSNRIIFIYHQINIKNSIKDVFVNALYKCKDFTHLIDNITHTLIYIVSSLTPEKW